MIRFLMCVRQQIAKKKESSTTLEPDAPGFTEEQFKARVTRIEAQMKKMSENIMDVQKLLKEEGMAAFDYRGSMTLVFIGLFGARMKSKDVADSLEDLEYSLGERTRSSAYRSRIALITGLRKRFKKKANDFIMLLDEILDMHDEEGRKMTRCVCYTPVPVDEELQSNRLSLTKQPTVWFIEETVRLLYIMFPELQKARRKKRQGLMNRRCVRVTVV